MDVNASNPLTTIKTEEISDSSGERNFNPIQPDPVKKLKRPLKPINGIKQMKKSSDTNARTSRNKGIREMENDQIRQFCNMFCDLCSTTQFGNFADANSHYRECHEILGYLVCCNLKLSPRNQVIKHIQIHINPESVKYVAICKHLDRYPFSSSF